MGLAQDPRYVSLARRAASRLGTSADPIVNAILAQWQCELGAGDAYPPRRNNPGNLARGAAETIGARYAVEPGSNPQPSNPIVTFSTPAAGADAYGKLLATVPRYADVRAAVRARDGRAYLQAINASGYGGSLACTLSVYGGSVVPGASAGFGGGGLPTPSGPGGIPVVATASSTLAAYLGIPAATLVTREIVLTAADRIATATGAYNRAYPVISSEMLGYLAGHPGISAGQFPIVLTGEGKPPGVDLFGDLFGWVPGVAANLAVVGGIAVLAYIGLRNVAEGLGEG